MASENMILGLFSGLPYEIREMIWKEFFPTSRHQHPLMSQRQKTDLSVLRANRALYDEISTLLYKNSCLTFTLTPAYVSWAVVTLDQSKEHSNDRHIGAKPIWSLESLADAKSRGFDNLPFHKIETVNVNLHPPNPRKKGEIFFLWRKVTDLVTIFKKAKRIHDLTIWLKKGIDGDWVDKWMKPHTSALYQIDHCRCDHDVVCLPFCTLRNVEEIWIETHSKELEDAIDWRIINVAMHTVWDRCWESVPSSRDYKISGHDVDRAVAADYFSMHVDLWKNPMEPEANLARRDFLSTWFEQGISGKSEFESQVLRITIDYPEIIKAYDWEMEFLDYMHTAMVCLYLHMKSLRGKLEDPEYWDQGVWSSVFPKGIPAMDSDEYWEELYPEFIDRDLYLDYMDKNTFLSTIGKLIWKWQDEHPNMDYDAQSSDDDWDTNSQFSCENCPGYKPGVGNRYRHVFLRRE
ncbi:hypothetical protein DTO280E4_3385 [Paecilomyces variotii]|nr:hypothetical protein DTO032I3_415 [Paecilomyces variotii]KAJ9279974.1 hypothetical protein DTO021D3_3202 [Paecilomyces variotii]KAJ9284557.1 hypothetical protein DTO021C3_7892 [Paecilomyces variotii]KAJ9339590.1 hypothetical protein DTO027B6_7823 [Paecilomyces variotii]KAJ9349691.1 hypothetical protein DTO027B9_7456 [Paecilomyces variotii]